ncbi:MAG: peptidoglycan-binding domain-containing protein [Pseudomonadota bacterium]
MARLSFLGFVAIAVSICANALYLQEAPVKTKITFTQPAKPQEQNPSIPTNDIITKAISPAQQSVIEDDDPGEPEQKSKFFPEHLVKAIQRELKAQGYEPGGVDGAVGLLTRAAILAFQYDKGLDLTAEPSDELLVKILVRPKDVKSTYKRSPSRTGQNVIRVIQTVLSDLGYSPGQVNGIRGTKTIAAIKEFEKDRNLKVTGRVSGKLVRELLSVTDIPLGGG